MDNTKKLNRFWYLLDYQEFNTKEEDKELQELYNELYDAKEFSERDLQIIDWNW